MITRINESKVLTKHILCGCKCIGIVHCIGKSYKNEGSGLTMKPTIIKFNSWRYRQDVYLNRTSRFENSQKKPGKNSFSILLDLTKQRYNL